MRKHRQNPWVDTELYFRSGFWDMEPNKYELFHVTPSFTKIEKSGEISSRHHRGTKAQGLGGAHTVSISAYGSLEHALYTLTFLYRVWQSYNNLLDLGPWLDTATGLDRYTLDPLIREQPRIHTEFVRDIANEMGFLDPILLSTDWLRDITEKDFALICFKNPCKHLLVNSLYRQKGFDGYIPPLDQASMRRLRNIVDRYTYLGSNNLSLNDDLYWKIRGAIHRGETKFALKVSPDLLGLRGFKDGIFTFENITFDINPQEVPIKDICKYDGRENEFQLFRPIPTSLFTDVYSIKQVLEEATRLNGGVEPFLWDIEKFKVFTEGRSIQNFKLATWRD